MEYGAGGGCRSRTEKENRKSSRYLQLGTGDILKVELHLSQSTLTICNPFIALPALVKI